MAQDINYVDEMALKEWSKSSDQTFSNELKDRLYALTELRAGLEVPNQEIQDLRAKMMDDLIEKISLKVFRDKRLCGQKTELGAQSSSATSQSPENSHRTPDHDSKVIYSRKRFLQQMHRNNSLQAKMLSKKHSLWNSCAAIDRNDSRNNWKRTLLLVKLLQHFKIPCPALDGEEYGVFGETPLHVLLLFNPKSDCVSNAFFDLWRLCSQGVKLKTYREEPYVGENLLHIAIVRGYGPDFFKKLLSESNDVNGLLEDHAVGKFFKNPIMSGGYFTMLGETPLGFAACSGDPAVFELLWGKFKLHHGSAVFKTAEKEHSLLHIAVLASASKDLRTGKPAPDILAVDIFDRVWNAVREGETAPHNLLTTVQDKDGHTPLSLAAAQGSIDIFRRIFDQELLTTLWTYNAVHCKKMFLEGIDVDLDAGGSAGGGGRLSLLETLVKYRRHDILHYSCINELVEIKWDMYGREIFYRELLATSLFTCAVFLLPMTRVEATWIFYAWQTRLWHIAAHALVALVSRGMCYSRTEPTVLQHFVFGDPDAVKFLATAVESELITYQQWVLSWPLKARRAVEAVGTLNLLVEGVTQLTLKACSSAKSWFQTKSAAVWVRVKTMFVPAQELEQGTEDGDMKKGESLLATYMVCECTDIKISCNRFRFERRGPCRECPAFQPSARKHSIYTYMYNIYIYIGFARA